MSFQRRKADKIKFLKKHKNFSKNAFRDAVRLRDKGESLRTSENVVALVRMARNDLHYADSTNLEDIFWSLMKVNHELENET